MKTKSATNKKPINTQEIIYKMTFHFIIIALMTLTLSSLSLADDTEIYLGTSTSSSTVKPNLTFIIDTSGSMSSKVTMAQGKYDPNDTYTGSCDPSKIYYDAKGKAPKCSTNNWFFATKNTCNASQTSLSIGGDGFYVTRAARYRSRKKGDRWDKLSSKAHNDPIECKDDFGIHGETNISTNLYPADQKNGGPWRADIGTGKKGAINWNRAGRTYTFYSANYLNWRNGSSGGTISKSRLTIVQEVFASLMNSVQDINIAIMRFDNKYAWYNKGGYFSKEMTPLTSTNQSDFTNVVNSFTPGGYTPLAETLYEAYQYYRGEAVKFGNSTTPSTNVSGVLDPTNSNKYISPIQYQCQKNFVILLTDGVPTYDTDADLNIESLPGFSATTGAKKCSGNCLDELADYMYKKDCRNNLDDTQNVITYTIGFNTNQTLLQDAANKGGGKYYTADDTAGLTDVFTSIITEILAINTTFIAPAVSVNAFNRFNHRNELYYALFKPNSRPKWNGNIKRFQLEGIPPEIVDANGNLAIDNNTGFFKVDATSVWTAAADAPDGDEVKKGGAASRLTLPRNIYTYTSATSPNETSIISTINKLHESNTAITASMLGDATLTSLEVSDILTWARGVDLFDDDSDIDTTDIRRLMGDPLHTKPVLITYGGTDTLPDITLFAGSNNGQLMAIDTTDGSEVFTFIPQELLPLLPTLYDDTTVPDHPYGLDGPLTTWVNDSNGNGILYNASNVLDTGEHAYLYQGMRRGGKNYYALDVTDRSAPLLKWIIKGGVGDYSELSQTWSSAIHGKIMINGAIKHVLFFGGGYDPSQDNASTGSNDTVGRAIYIADAETGAKIWQAGPSSTSPDLSISQMTNSIPADLSVLDVNGDGLIDLIFAADQRGQLFRIDIDNTNNTGANNLATGGRVASLAGSTASENRRFYYAPDISISNDRTHINIAIGSGYRAHPLDQVIHDAFYVIHDYNIHGPALNGSGIPTYATITMSDLYDATANTIGQGTAAEIKTAKASLAGKQGFYIWLNEADGSYVGEKVLARSLTFDNKVIFTTYKPVSSPAGTCSPSQGSAGVYIISLYDGTAIIDANLSGGDTLTREDRRVNLIRGGIPPEPTIIVNENGLVGLVGTEKIPVPGLSLLPKKYYWQAQ